MCRTMLVIALVLGLAAPVMAQEWIEYQNIQDGFKINFPGQPKIMDTTWVTGQGYVLPARIYSGEMASSRYSMTVVDYNVIERLGMERSEKCPVGAETCQGQPAGQLRSVIGPGYATQEIRDALLNATYKLLQRDAKLTALLWNFEDLVEGYELHLVNNKDQSRTMAFVAMHENKLYVMEGTVPKGYPEPGLFYQSLGWVDKNGNGIRYQQVYVNEFHGLRIIPVPPRAGQNPAPQPPPAAAR
ncbi:MAG: hypothetical protein DMF87_08980 [Acidobacteria bacterium]|nr:MAG: hypothetical protein DMF87_08980 [Acidobacteriota bacterium]